MDSKRSSTDVVIVGGGVIGLAVAWRTARRGLRTILIERDRPGHATTHVAAGMIAPIAEAQASEPELLSLALRSARLYPGFIRELAQEAGRDPGYRLAGTLLVARDADEAAALERELDLRNSFGLPVRRLRPSEARALEPALAPTLRLGLEIPDDRSVDPRALCGALTSALAAAGGELVAGVEVARVTVTDGRVTGVTCSDRREIEADSVVIAAGPWSAQVAGLPERARVPLRPVKGQIIALRDPSGPGLVERVIRTAPGYLVPRGDGRYVLGATVEERGFDTTVTAGALFQLLRDAAELIPGVSELVVEELLAGIRPGTPDNLPIIGPGALPGLVWATGHYRHGILLAPITAEIVAGLLAGDGVPEGAAQFAPARFQPALSGNLGGR